MPAIEELCWHTRHLPRCRPCSLCGVRASPSIQRGKRGREGLRSVVTGASGFLRDTVVLWPLLKSGRKCCEPVASQRQRQ